MIHPLVMAAMAGTGLQGTVQVTSPLTVASSNPGGLCTSGVAFQTDGGLDELGPDIATIVATVAGEYFSDEPSANIGANYDVRCASISVGSWVTEAAAVGTWVNMSAQRIWFVRVTAMGAPDVDTCTAVFEIRSAGGGATLATFTVNAEAAN